MEEERQKERDGDSEKGQHRRRRGRLKGDQQAGYIREGERKKERKKERDGERVPGLIYRRGVSVIISPSLSRPTLGSERLSRAPLPSFHPSNLSICTLPATVIAVVRSHLSAHRSRSLRGTLEWPRRLSALSARLIHHFSPLLFPRTSRERSGEQGWIRERTLHLFHDATSNFPILFCDTTEISGILGSLSLTLSLYLSFLCLFLRGFSRVNRGVSRRR